jgi:hypothetical protein
MEFLLRYFTAFKAFGLVLATMYPIIGENIMLMKKDHSTPIFLRFPIVSEITSDRAYHTINIIVIQ